MDTPPFDLPRYLAVLPLFSDLDTPELERLARGCQLRRFGRGEDIFRVGEPCEEFHVTVTGQVKYDATRRLVLRGVDGIVFVADGMAVRRETNIHSLRNLQDNLASYRKSLDALPWILQYNKMDLKDQGIPMMPIAMLEQDLNGPFHRPYFPSSALQGINVVATLKKIISLTVASIRQELL